MLALKFLWLCGVLVRALGYPSSAASERMLEHALGLPVDEQNLFLQIKTNHTECLLVERHSQSIQSECVDVQHPVSLAPRTSHCSGMVVYYLNAESKSLNATSHVQTMASNEMQTKSVNLAGTSRIALGKAAQ